MNVNASTSKFPRFWRNINSIEEELVYQILFAELAFTICSEIPIIPGKGSDIVPYFYNLNFSKGIIALHSILLSKNPDDICFKNYFDQYKWEYKQDFDKDLQKKITEVTEEFKKMYEPSIRHKIAAHTSQQFSHTDFTNAYIMPQFLKKLSNITEDLKQIFFTHGNYSKHDDPFAKIKLQAREIVKTFS